MAPRISPNKSVEGAVGGLVGAVLAALIVRIYSPWLPTRDAIILGLVIGLVGQWGDLFESAFKRDFRVKDSGDSCPGMEASWTGSIPYFLRGFTAYWAAVVLLGDVVR